jgi:hypothetical protein
LGVFSCLRFKRRLAGDPSAAQITVMVKLASPIKLLF